MTALATHPALRRQIDELIVGQLGANRHLRLREHLRECDGCRAYYDRVRAVEDQVLQTAAADDPALARLAELVVRSTAPRPQRRWLGALVPALAAVTAAVALVLAVPWPAEELQVRGGDAQLGEAGLAVFRVDAAAGGIARLPRTTSAVPLRAGDVVQLGYRNRDQRYAVVLGVDAAWSVQWYHPATPQGAQAGVRIASAVIDEPFGEAWQITAAPGPMRLFAWFGPEPVAVATVEAAVARARREGGDLRRVDALPGLDGVQDSVLFEVQR